MKKYVLLMVIATIIAILGGTFCPAHVLVREKFEFVVLGIVAFMCIWATISEPSHHPWERGGMFAIGEGLLTATILVSGYGLLLGILIPFGIEAYYGFLLVTRKELPVFEDTSRPN